MDSRLRVGTKVLFQTGTYYTITGVTAGMYEVVWDAGNMALYDIETFQDNWECETSSVVVPIHEVITNFYGE